MRIGIGVTDAEAAEIRKFRGFHGLRSFSSYVKMAVLQQLRVDNDEPRLESNADAVRRANVQAVTALSEREHSTFLAVQNLVDRFEQLSAQTNGALEQLQTLKKRMAHAATKKDPV